MLQLLILFLVQAPGASAPDIQVLLRDHPQGPTAVTDKDLRPGKAPDCRTESEIQRTLEQLSHGEAGDCFIRDIKRLGRR